MEIGDKPDSTRADREAEERIDALLLQGLDSGPSILVTAEYWAEKKRQLMKRLGEIIGPKG